MVTSPTPERPGGSLELAGPTTARSYRDLSGRGWAVGANLRPAALAVLIEDPGELRDGSRELSAPELLSSVSTAMASGPVGHASAVEGFAAWLIGRVGESPEQALLANSAAELLMGCPEVVRPEDAAARLAISVRTLQRLIARYVGLTPAAMIRRRRLQEAAERVRTEPDVDLATLAAELGYADHAHLTHEFRRVLAMAPSEYRRRT